MQIFVRRALESDADSINRIAAASWLHTYRDIYDAEEIGRWIERNYSPETLRKHISVIENDRAYLFIVALVENNIEGFMELKVRDRTTELLRIYITPDLTGNGIGSELLRHGENWMMSNGERRLTVSVHKKNLPGVRFYEARGFRFKEEIEQHIVLDKNLVGS